MNAYALKALLSDPTAYEVVEAARSRPGQRELIAVNAPEFAPWAL
jgi:UDP-3-O-[3-hydroxymyristoyl] N-acetylglucosamine deacetylase